MRKQIWVWLTTVAVGWTLVAATELPAAILQFDDYESLSLGPVQPNDLDNWWWNVNKISSVDIVGRNGGKAFEVTMDHRNQPLNQAPIWGTKRYRPYLTDNMVSLSADMRVSPPTTYPASGTVFYTSYISLRLNRPGWSQIHDIYFFRFVTWRDLLNRNAGRLDLLRMQAFVNPDGTIRREYVSGGRSGVVPIDGTYRNYELQARLLEGGQLQLSGWLDGRKLLEHTYADADVGPDANVFADLRVITSPGTLGSARFDNVLLASSTVPEPASMATWGMVAVIGLAFWRRRRRPAV